MSFAREGLPLIAIAALVAAGTYALALNRRSWPLWLLAFALTIAALWVAYVFSDSRRPIPRGAQTAAVTSISLVMNETNVPVDRFRVSAR